MSPVMVSKQGLGTSAMGSSIEDLRRAVDEIQPLVVALAAYEIQEPNMPIPKFVDECFARLAAARENFEALASVGVTEEQLEEFEKLIIALAAAQALWNAERCIGRQATVSDLIAKAIEKRSYLVAAAKLALRNNPDGLYRLSNIRENNGLADLVADLTDLALLINGKFQLFDAIKLDSQKEVDEAAMLRNELQKALANEDVSRTIRPEKATRDAAYTLTRKADADLRAFAEFAFRDDKDSKIRVLFTSEYKRRQRRRRKNGKSPDASDSSKNGKAERIETTSLPTLS